MGCVHTTPIYSTNKNVLTLKPQFDALMLTEEDVGRLYRVFKRIDMDNSGSVDSAEFLTLMNVERTKFTVRIFSIFDEDKSGKIDFREMVLSLWNYCSLGKASLVMFAFDIYDRDDSGTLTNTEVLRILRDVYGKQYEENAQAKM